MLISRAHRSDDPERLKSGSQIFDHFESLGLLLFRKFILDPGVLTARFIRGHKRSQRENGEVDQSPENKGFPKGFEGL